MTSSVREIFHAFVPLFVAMDVVGVAPVYLGLTQPLSPQQKRRVLRASLLAAAAVSFGFALLGKGVFVFLGITVADLQIAGGLILIGLAGFDLLAREPKSMSAQADVGVCRLACQL